MHRLFAVFLATLLLAVPAPLWSAEERLPIIDAHSQLEDEIAPERAIEMMDAAHVSRTILAARRQTTIKDMITLARKYPDRITAAVRIKSGAYQDKPLGAFKKFLDKQLQHGEFAAMAEVLMYHARKTDKKGKTIAPEVAFLPNDSKPQAALDVALSKGWPFVIHIEFASVGAERAKYMKAMESMLHSHPEHPFLLIHMGQLGPKEAERLLEAHTNLSFIPAHTTPVTLAESHEPWTPLFKGEKLLPAWRALILAHPDRFVLGFDNVWARHWEEFYLPQVKLWRRALADLPDDVAHAVAHRNAERLWHLPPAP